MRKELIAFIALVLLFAASLVNIHYLNKLTGEVSELVEQASSFVESEDWEKALEYAEKAYEKWDKSDTYTHMVLRHSEIESAGESLGELLKELYAENTGAAIGAAKTASARMKSIASIEQIKPGSIF